MTKAQRAGDAPIAVEVEKDKSYYWCHLWKKFKTTILRWTHKGSEFTPLAYKAEETKKVFFCACKETITSLFAMAHSN